VELPNIDALPGLVIALGLAPVCGFAILRIVLLMVDGELGAGPGTVALIAMLAVLVVTIMSKSSAVAGVVIVVLVSLIVFFPYAVEQVASAEVRGMDIDKLDRVHREIIERPENVASYFALAEIVHALGLEGHGIVIAEQTLQRLSTEMDPIKNQSLRDVFRNEEARAKQWRRNVRDIAAFRAVACPRCGRPNEPGTIACVGCQGPFLLELARKIDPRARIRQKLVVGFALVAGFLTGTVYAWTAIEGDLRLVAFGLGLGTVAGVFTWMFQPRLLGRQ
jgi:hypothetical protein